VTLDYESAILNVSLLWMLTVPHEFAHAWTAVKLGDDTPAREGRVTLHPLAHVDWLGTVILPGLLSLFSGGFLGWGKPVNTNPYNLRGGNRGLALVALAGPASNILFAVILAAITVALMRVAPEYAAFPARGVYLSLFLAMFNMIPVPPLDGSKLLLLARAPTAIYYELARAGFLILLVLITATPLGRWLSATSYLGAHFLLSLFR
jgi:Zn-dependent protease